MRWIQSKSVSTPIKADKWQSPDNFGFVINLIPRTKRACQKFTRGPRAGHHIDLFYAKLIEVSSCDNTVFTGYRAIIFIAYGFFYHIVNVAQYGWQFIASWHVPWNYAIEALHLQVWNPVMLLPPTLKPAKNLHQWGKVLDDSWANSNADLPNKSVVSSITSAHAISQKSSPPVIASLRSSP